MFLLSENTKSKSEASDHQRLHLNNVLFNYRHRMTTITMMVFDPRGEGKLICSAIVPTERIDMVSIIFEELRRIAPEACQKVSVFMSDLTHVFETAWKATFGEDGGPTFAKCAMHVEEAWKRNIKNEDMLNIFKELRTDGSEESVMQKYGLYEDLKNNPEAQIERWPDDNERRVCVAALVYFFDNYGLNGQVAQLNQFCRYYLNGSCAHQIHLERQHLKLKVLGKPCDRIDQAVANFEAVEQWEANKEISVDKRMRNVKKSKAQVYHNDNHPDENQIVNYFTEDLENGDFLIRNPDQEEYIVSQNPFEQCDMDKCQVLCRKCGIGSPCAHTLRCTCKSFGLHNYCKHTHIIVGRYFTPQNNGSVAAAQVNKNRKKTSVSASLQRIGSLKSQSSQLYSDQRRENEGKDKEGKDKERKSASQQSNKPNQPGDPNNNPSCSGDHQDLTKNLKELVLNAKRECFEEVGELKRAVERADQTEDSLKYLQNLKQKVLALSKDGKPVESINWKRAHVPVRNVRRPNAKEQRRKHVKIPPADCHNNFLIPMMFAGGVDHDYWPTLFRTSMKQIERFIDEQPPEAQRDLQIKLEEAKTKWNCRCGEQHLISIQSGFIPCYYCNRMFHQSCLNMEVSIFRKAALFPILLSNFLNFSEI